MIKEILHPEIHYYKNVIADPSSFVKEIEDMDAFQGPFSQISQWEQWNASNSNVPYGKLKKCFLNMFQNITDADRSNAKLCSMITQNVISIGEEYAASSGIDLGYLPVYFGINKYNVGVHMGAHVDAYDGAEDTSTVSMVMYLNDDYEGGEIEFPNHGISLKPEAGSVVVFASEGVLHDPKPTISGTKYMVPIFFFKR
jgi:Rps23 Pro-64 3,4-dihydroxylase Tpa1-like proline 4-hydroxylase